MNTKINLLYLTFDGLTDSLGKSQIVPLINNLSNIYSVNIVTLEKKNKFKMYYKIKKELMDKNNLSHNYYFYHKNPIFKFYSCILYFYKIIQILINNKINIIHIRGYQPLIFLLPIIFFKKINIIFDIRGFWADEKVDRHNWSISSYKYKFFKKIEKFFFNYSKIIVCLTNNSKNILIDTFKVNKNKIFVIPTCSSKTKFYNNINDNNKNNKKIKTINIGHIGTTIGAYNFEKTILIIKSLIDKKINVHFNIFTHDNPLHIVNSLKKYKINEKNYSIKGVNYENIENYINDLNFIIFYLKHNYSIKASFPTKIAEVLLCGKPIICNYFNDDISKIIEENDFIYGVENEKTDISLLINFIEKILINEKEYSNKIRNFAINNYEHAISFKIYNEIYSSLINE